MSNQSIVIQTILAALAAANKDINDDESGQHVVISAETTKLLKEAHILASTNALTVQEVEDEKSVAPAEHRQLNRVNLKSFIEEQKGKLVSVTFVKLNGDVRQLTGRLGVTAPLKGGENTSEAAERPYLTMFDNEIKDYRNVNLSTVSQLRAAGQTFNIID